MGILDDIPMVMTPEVATPEVTPDHRATAEPRKPLGIGRGEPKLTVGFDDEGKKDTPFGKTPTMPNKGVIAKGVDNLYTTLGAFLSPFDPVCGSALIDCAENAGESLEELARANPKVRKALMALLETGAWGGVIAAHAPLIMAIYIHHANKPKNNDGDNEPPKPKNRFNVSTLFPNGDVKIGV